ncbi:MAG TPA: imidazolonepropionase [Terriglobales bacterium]|nr:imidazolonepropionase [Terriglobales bacterium]
MPEAMPLRKRNTTEAALLLVNIRQLLTLRSPGAAPRRGRDLSDLGLIEDGAVLSLGGKIVSVGKTKDALSDAWIRKNRKKIRKIDCGGKVVLPGFVDSHTHPAFTAPRLVDFEQRIAGATYEQIAEAGGGIRSSVEGVRKATRAALAGHVLAALNAMLMQGTTTVEAKSGYGLSLDAELKSLEAIGDAAREWPGTVAPTLLGAHVVPREYEGREDKYVRIVCKEMIPRAAERKLARFVDVFCDRGAFSSASAEHVFLAAREHGLGVRAHVCQLSHCEIAPLLKYDPASLDHMDYAGDDDIAALAAQSAMSPAHQTVATLVPGANHFLGLGRFPDARRLIDSGVPVALATDYNPGTSPTISIPFVLSLACTHMKMTPAEAIAAATINGAHALRLAGRKGSIEPGKDADLAIFDVADYREIPYWIAGSRCAAVIVAGIEP